MNKASRKDYRQPVELGCRSTFLVNLQSIQSVHFLADRVFQSVRYLSEYSQKKHQVFSSDIIAF